MSALCGNFTSSEINLISAFLYSLDAFQIVSYHELFPLNGSNKTTPFIASGLEDDFSATNWRQTHKVISLYLISYVVELIVENSY